jgi:hypothetical protein
MWGDDPFGVEDGMGGDQAAAPNDADMMGEPSPDEEDNGSGADALAAFDVMMKTMESAEAEEAEEAKGKAAAAEASRDKIGIQGTKSSINFHPSAEPSASAGGCVGAGADDARLRLMHTYRHVETEEEPAPRSIADEDEGGMLGRMLEGMTASAGVSAVEVEASIEEAKRAEAEAIADYEAEDEPGLSLEAMRMRDNDSGRVISHAQSLAPRQLSHYQRPDERPQDRFTQTAAGRLQLESTSGQIHKFVVETVKCTSTHNGVKWTHTGPLRADPLEVFQPNEHELVVTATAPILHSRKGSAERLRKLYFEVEGSRMFEVEEVNSQGSRMFEVEEMDAADESAVPAVYNPTASASNPKPASKYRVVTVESLKKFHQQYCPVRLGQEAEILAEFPPQTLVDECEKAFGASPEMMEVDPKQRAMNKMQALRSMAGGFGRGGRRGSQMGHELTRQFPPGLIAAAGQGVTKISLTMTPRVDQGEEASAVDSTEETAAVAAAAVVAVADADEGEEIKLCVEIERTPSAGSRRMKIVAPTRALQNSSPKSAPDLSTLSCSSTIFLSPRELTKQAKERLEKGEPMSDSQMLQQQQMLELSESVQSNRTYPGFPHPSNSLFSGGLPADASSLIPNLAVSKVAPKPRMAQQRGTMASQLRQSKTATKAAALKKKRAATAAELRSPSRAGIREDRPSQIDLLGLHLDKNGGNGPTTYDEVKAVLQLLNIAPAADSKSFQELQCAYRETMPLIKFAGGTIGSEQWQARAATASSAGSSLGTSANQSQWNQTPLTATSGGDGEGFTGDRLAQMLMSEVSSPLPPNVHGVPQRGITRNKLQAPGGWENGRTSINTSAAVPILMRAHTADTLRAFDVQRFDHPKHQHTGQPVLGTVGGAPAEFLDTMGLSPDCTSEFLATNFSFLPSTNEMKFWQAVDAFLVMVKQLQRAQHRRVAVDPSAYNVCWTRAKDIYETFIERDGDMALSSECIASGVALDLKRKFRQIANFKVSRSARSKRLPLAGPPPASLFDQARKGTMVAMLRRLQMGRSPSVELWGEQVPSDGEQLDNLGAPFDGEGFEVEDDSAGDQSSIRPRLEDLPLPVEAQTENQKALEKMRLELEAAQRALAPKKMNDAAVAGTLMATRLASKMRNRADDSIISQMLEDATAEAVLAGADVSSYYMGGSLDNQGGQLEEVEAPDAVRDLFNAVSSPLELEKMKMRKEGASGKMGQAQSVRAQQRIEAKKKADAETKEKKKTEKAKKEAKEKAAKEAKEQGEREAIEKVAREAQEKSEKEEAERAAEKKAKQDAKAAKKSAEKRKKAEKKVKRKAAMAQARGASLTEEHTGYTSSEDEKGTEKGSDSESEYSDSDDGSDSNSSATDSTIAKKKKKQKKKKKKAKKKAGKAKVKRGRKSSTASTISIADSDMTDPTSVADSSDSDSTVSSANSSLQGKKKKAKAKKKTKAGNSLLKTATKNTAAGNLDFFSPFAAPAVKKNRRAQPWDTFGKKGETVTVDDLERMRDALVTKSTDVEQGPIAYLGIGRDEEIVADGYVKRRRMVGERRIHKFNEPGENRLNAMCESQKEYRDEIEEEKQAGTDSRVFDPTAMISTGAGGGEKEEGREEGKEEGGNGTRKSSFSHGERTRQRV